MEAAGRFSGAPKASEGGRLAAAAGCFLRVFVLSTVVGLFLLLGDRRNWGNVRAWGLGFAILTLCGYAACPLSSWWLLPMIKGVYRGVGVSGHFKA